MIIRGKLRLAAAGAVGAAAFLALQGQPASAQMSWDWAGGTREVVSFNPRYGAGQIVVSFGDKRLYYVTQAGQAISYPIAVPREKSRWQGVTAVSQKREHPSWTPTPDMIRENPRLPRWVPGGHPMNPLGVRALYLGSSMYRIHGTDAPWTIGTAASKGCIRLYNEDVLDLYPRVRIGTKVTVTYQTFTTSGAVTTTAKASPKSKAAPEEGSVFDWFGNDDDDPPAKKQAKRPRAKQKSTSTSTKTAPAERRAEVAEVGRNPVATSAETAAPK
jgi:hypothetical protein